MIIVAVGHKQLRDIRGSDPRILYIFHYARMTITGSGINKRGFAVPFDEINRSIR